MLKKRSKLSPVVVFMLMTLIVIILSGFLNIINFQAEYTTINKVTNELVNNVVGINNLLSPSGIKYIVTTAVNYFMNYTPLSMLIIVLFGIGLLEKIGFIQTFFTLITRNAKRYTLTFLLILISLISSILGDIGYVIMLPLGALLFKYGRRNPLGGIIASFASLSFGKGINVLLSATDSSLLTLTTSAARLIDPKYSIDIFFSLFIMIFLLIITALIFTNITEKKIMPRLSRFEAEDEEIKVGKRELRGLIVGIGAGILYLLIIIYMIIPGLPLSGALLDSSGARYIDMLFGNNALFAQGFVFIVTLLFLIVGIGYGIMTKKITNTKDVADGLAHSLDGIGSILVLIFFASLFIGVYNESEIGIVFTAMINGIISKLSFSGVGLVIMSFILIAISNIFLPSSILKWNIFSATLIPLFINSSISPEFAQVLFTCAESITGGLTPLMVYFVIYIAFIHKYGDKENLSFWGCIKYMLPYAFATLIINFIIVVGWYISGIPIGIWAFPGVSYGA